MAVNHVREGERVEEKRGKRGREPEGNEHEKRVNTEHKKLEIDKGESSASGKNRSEKSRE